MPTPSLRLRTRLDRGRARAGRRLGLLLVALAILGPRAARANTCTWKPSGSTNPQSYGSSGRWSCGTIPSNGSYDVVFDGSVSNIGCSLSSDISVTTITFQNGYSGTLTVGSHNVTVAQAVTMSTGTFGASSKTVSIGSLSVQGGTFTASSSATQVAGAFSVSGGTFQANGGTVTLTGSGALGSNGNHFNVLTISASGTYTLQDALATDGTLTVSSGTLTAGSNAVTVSGDLSLIGGTFNASSNTTSVAGSFNNSGGTFSANGGTVALTGSGTVSTGASSLNVLTVAASGTYTLASTLLLGGSLAITSGTLAAGTQSVSVGGSWSNAGTFTFTAPQSVTLTGTSSSATITSGGSAFDLLTVNGSGGTYTLQDALSTTGDLTVSAGTVAAGANTVSVGGKLNLSGGSFTGGAGTVSVTSDLSITGGSYSGGAGKATVGGNVSLSATVTGGGDPTLVGYWTLDDTSSSAADSSGNGNTLTWNGSPSATTSVAPVSFTDTHSLSMTGNQYAGSAALSGISELTPTTISLSAWYKATSVDTSGSEIISGSNTYGLRITTSGITVMKRITDNTSKADWIEYRVPETGHLDGNWHQIVGVILTGTGGGMSAYLDGVVAAGTYWVNGSNGAQQLSGSTTPTAATAATDPVDWDGNTETYGFIVGNNPSTNGYHFGAGCSGTACAIDDVRVYSRALSAADVAALSTGSRPANTSGLLTLAGAMDVTGTVTVQSTGTLTLPSGSSLAVGSALTMDGTLTASGGTIEGNSGSYSFHVGSTSGATPTLNIDGLSVANTDANGMFINYNTGATTTFAEFDALAFSSGTAGTGSALLQIYAPTLYLTATGCSFDGSTSVAVKLTGNGTGSGAGPRALFGGATCAVKTNGLCATSEKSDDDANNDGVPDHPTTNGAVVQFVRASTDDTAGTAIGYPTAAFDWSTFSYYSTYAAFHDASGGSDVIYVRDESGSPLYAWTDPSPAETITGTPQWTTVGGTHYLYVSVNGASGNTGKVYRLIDSGSGTTSGTLKLDSSWATSGAYSCTCTITSALTLDASNVYWAATNSSGQKLFGITQSPAGPIKSGWPVTAPANVTTSAPTFVTATSSLYLGATSTLAQLDFTHLTWTQDVPTTSAPVTKLGTVTGRVSYGTSLGGTSRIYLGDASGNVWAVSPTAFSGTNYLWEVAAGSAVTNTYYDNSTDTVQFGTAGGKVIALTGGSGGYLNTSYPYTLNASDPITAAPLYLNGVLAVGTSQGKLYLLDRNTGLASPKGVAIIQEYSFGPSESVSTVGYDANANRYMVSTSSSLNDGRIYYFDAVSDPTPSSS